MAAAVGAVRLFSGSAHRPRLAGCAMFPPDNAWNMRVDSLPVASNSAAIIDSIGAATGLHPDFGSGTWNGGPIGIPYNLVPATQKKLPVSFRYADESDRGPYPIPAKPKIEYGGDRHLLMVDTGACRLYELYTAKKSGSKWKAGSGAVWSLDSNAVRPAGWTSADAAGLPILPGLARWDEVAAGEI